MHKTNYGQNIKILSKHELLPAVCFTTLHFCAKGTVISN